MAGRTPLIRRPKYRCALFRFQKCPVSSPSLQNYTLLFLFSGTTLLFKPLSRSGGWKKPLSPPHFRSPSFRNELMHRRHPFRSIMQKSNQQFIWLKKGEYDYWTWNEESLDFSEVFWQVFFRWSNNFEKCIEGRLDVNLLGLDNCRGLFKGLWIFLRIVGSFQLDIRAIYFRGDGRMRNRRWIEWLVIFEQMRKMKSN